MDNSRLHAERHWHDEHFSHRDYANLQLSESIKKRYLSPPKRPIFPLEMMYLPAGDLRGKRVLCYGCGDSKDTVLLALMGAEVWAIDLSEEALRTQQLYARANGIEDRMRLVCCAAELLPFAAASFDMVFGVAILHHVPDSLPAVARQIRAVVKLDGQALFSEPIAFSSMLASLRKWVSVHQDLSPGERQLTQADLLVFASHFVMQTYYFRLMSRLERFLPAGRLEGAAAWWKSAVYFVYALDWLLLKVPFVRRFAGIAVLRFTPKTYLCLRDRGN